MKPSEPLVSVVTPFYNTAAYLTECIESVQRQSYSNWEYVLVDNCSTDGSSEIAARYASNDARVSVIRNERLLPQVPNYNRALQCVAPAAEFVKVVEADNWLFPECLAQMVAVAQAHPSVGVVGSYNKTETQLRFTGLSLSRNIVPGRELWHSQFARDTYLFGAPTSVLMRADLVRQRQPFYDERLAVAEDLSACWDLLRVSDFGFVHQVLTFVRTENPSILSAIKGFEPQALDRLLLMHRHGRDFMDPPEFEATYKRVSDFYYRVLARGFLSRQGPAFWKYHRSGLAAEGLRLNRAALFKAISRELAGLLARPHKLGKMARRR